MFDLMKQLGQILAVYSGSAATVILAWVARTGLQQAQDVITILVGLATLVYTIYKISDMRAKRNHRRKHDKNERH
jgi:hypothetical protein